MSVHAGSGDFRPNEYGEMKFQTDLPLKQDAL